MAFGFVTVGCASSTAEPGLPESGHVHDLGLVDDRLYAATHTGLFVGSEGSWTPLGQGRHDLMALAVDRDGTLLASGHPDLRTEDLRLDDRPPLLGLLRSSDQGLTWSPESLLGSADFHALVVTSEGIVAADGSSGTIMASADGHRWETRGALEVSDLAVAPDEPDSLAGVTYEGELQVSDDGGRQWRRTGAAPMTAVAWTRAFGLVAASKDGGVLASTDGGSTWHQRGRLPAPVDALLAAGDRMWAAVEGGTVLHSSDGGASWEPWHQPS